MIKEFLIYLEKEKNYSKHTRTSYKNDLSYYFDFLDQEIQTTFKKVKVDELRFFIVFLKKNKLSNSTINRKIATLKSFYKFLHQIEILKNNPAKTLKSLKIPKRLPDFYTNKEIESIFNSFEFKNDFKGTRDKLILLILFSTGVRQSELINIKNTDIHIIEKQIKVLGKGGKERYVFLTNELITLINKYLIYREELNFDENKHFLTTDKGNKMYPKFVYKVVNYYLSYISKGRKASPHTLRHSYATELMNKEVEINSIKKTMGHSSLTSTEVYTHNSKERLIKQYQTYHPRGGNKKENL